VSLDEKTGLEYMLLRNYQDNGFVGRGFLLRILFVVLKRIEQDKWDFKIEQNIILSIIFLTFNILKE
jgi:hypothetical protein